MKIAIVSDIHDNLPNLKKFLEFIRKERVKSLIVCGDVGVDEETLKFLSDNFKEKIFFTPGNMDVWQNSKNQNPRSRIKLFETAGELEIDGLKIALTHFPPEAKRLALNAAENYDFVFYGHNHKPWLEQIGNCLLANPGNLAGLYYKASFALLETKTKKLSLKILEQI